MTKKFINRLIALSDDIESDRPYNKIKVVAFLIYKNKILSFGVNSEKTSLYQYKMRRQAQVNDSDFVYDKTHAEIAAIKKIHPSFSNWEHVEIFICSKKKDSSLRLSRPCPICEKTIKDMGIKKVYYTNSYGGVTKEIFMN